MTDARDARLRRLYGISAVEYDAILAYQGGVCAVCGALPGSRRLAVDHRHSDGITIGILCFSCNSKLSERVSVEWLRAALAYLRSPPAKKALGRTPQGVVGRIGTKRRRRRGKR